MIVFIDKDQICLVSGCSVLYFTYRERELQAIGFNHRDFSVKKDQKSDFISIETVACHEIFHCSWCCLVNTSVPSASFCVYPPDVASDTYHCKKITSRSSNFASLNL